MQKTGFLYHDVGGMFAECCYGASYASSIYATAQAAVDGWMSSTEGHREILLDPRYRQGAVGIARDNGFWATYRCLDLIGGLGSLIRPSDKVLLKINHLSPASSPDRGIITHPIFVEAILHLLKDYSLNITVADDIESIASDGFAVSGFREMCKRAGVDLLNFKQKGFLETECDGFFLKKVHLSKAALDADVLINLPKLKTHSLTVLTGGVKNMYGTIPNGLRTRFHGDYVRPEDFGQVLVDIFSAIKPQLTIMDGVVTMEGEGPASGSLREVGVILASQDAVALDAVATKIIGLDPMDIYTTKYATERGLGIGNLQDIEVVGETLEDVSVTDFKLPASATGVLTRKAPRILTRHLLPQLSVRPEIVKGRCTGCFECESVCPVSAILRVNGRAEINPRKCIRCMCCHEVCHFHAIVPKRTMVGSALELLANRWQKLMGSVG
jgi:uncharacterized protein (DUF362 family)/Pyruvate/2-oxoacid:ferredoxin oxidoreductase delta subunit